MADGLKKTKQEEQLLSEVVPTLYIALGGTGAEILWRIRRRILNSLWGTNTNQPVRLNNLSEFPFAEFLHFDLDANTKTETGKSANTDILSSKIQFTEEEKLVKKLDILKYVRTDDELAKYPMVQEWFPLSRSKVNELNIDPEKGAGQIRSISRLYFFDKYQDIKSAIRNKADTLLANVSSSEASKRLGLQVQTGALKIVVIASTAGGTGSGAFIDMGYLATIVGKQVASAVSTNLVMLLPTGYKNANLDRTQANTYAALMELETSMRQGLRYVKGWADGETIRDMPEAPYNDTYFIDTGNVAGAQTEQIDDIYDMVADSLFEDFSTADFANKKRSISVNQQQHKITPYESRVDQEVYGDIKLSFSRGYSSFGQATIDTHLDQKQNVVLFRQVNGMLKAFFGVSDESKTNTPTEKYRDELLRDRLQLGMDNITIDYDFVKETEQFRQHAERTNYPLVSDLLRVNTTSRIDDIEQKISITFDNIEQGGSYKEWKTKISEEIAKIDLDIFKDLESSSGIHDDGVKKRRGELFAELLNPESQGGLIKALWSSVDNKELGGLDYTINLIGRLKDSLENAQTGLVQKLEKNAKWFADLSGHLRNEETGTLIEHLDQAIGKFFGAEDQAKAKLQQISKAVRLYVRYQLYAIASREAAVLVQEISDALGKQQGTDHNGNPIWAGFIGQLEAGRGMVRSIIADAENQIDLTSEAMKQEHAMYFVIPAPKSNIDDLELLPPEKAREWAEDAFKDLGGTEQLFTMLQDKEGQDELLGKLRNRALSLISADQQKNEINPLFKALDNHPNRSQLFSDFMLRALPWVHARLQKYLRESNPQDQYKCLIGVKDSKKFSAQFGKELAKHIPSSSMMTAKQIAFVEIEQAGKLVCYTELSGIPIAAMKDLEIWHHKYSQADIPTHTHHRISKFVHAIELTTDELASHADDLKLFIEAAALGVISREEKGRDEGVYTLKVKGNSRRIGDEKLLRLNGLDARFRSSMAQEVERDIEKLESAEQIALWLALLNYYHQSVYTLALRDKDGKDVEVKGLPTLICERLVNHWQKRLDDAVGNEADALSLLLQADDALFKWTDELSGSEDDVYKNEVSYKKIKAKRTLKFAVLSSNWSLSGEQQQSAGNGAATMDPPPPPANGATPPPLPTSNVEFYIMIRGKQYGPYNQSELTGFVPTGQLTAQSMVWRKGMTEWQAAGQVDELAALFASQTSVAPPLPTDGTPPPPVV